MNDISHYGTCPVWRTGNSFDCSCYLPPPWRIRKEDAEAFPWRIWRRMTDFSYEPVMRCRSWDEAMTLVLEFLWLREHVMRRTTGA